MIAGTTSISFLITVIKYTSNCSTYIGTFVACYVHDTAVPMYYQTIHDTAVPMY